MATLPLLLVKFGEDVVTKESGSFDHALLMAFRVSGDLSKLVGPQWLQSAFVDITSLGSPVIITLATLVAAAYPIVTGNKRLDLLVAVSIGLGSIVEPGLTLARRALLFRTYS